MTGYTVHTGASKKFVSGWDRVFGDAEPTNTGEKSASARKKPAGTSKSSKKEQDKKKK